MNSLSYPACIRELYESEILSEAASLALLDAAKNEYDRYRFGTLLQLETETKARLRPFLARHGIPLDERADLSSIAGIVGAYTATGSFREFAGAIMPVAQAFLSRFEEMARIGPAEDSDVLESMVRHEAAILEWFALESEGRSEGALGSLISQLQYPLPRP